MVVGRQVALEIGPLWVLRQTPQQLQRLLAGRRVCVPFTPRTKARQLDAACASLMEAGASHVVVHLPARRFLNEAQLSTAARKLLRTGVRDFFALAGDGTEEDDRATGRLTHSVTVLRALERLASSSSSSHPTTVRSVGVSAYPQGHATAADADVEAAFAEKLDVLRSFPASVSPFVVTQLCLDGPDLAAWMQDNAAAVAGIPVYAGLFGDVPLKRALALFEHVDLGPA